MKTGEETKQATPPKLRKGQKCWLCEKEIKKDWCWNGHYWHNECKEKDTYKMFHKIINKFRK